MTKKPEGYLISEKAQAFDRGIQEGRRQALNELAELLWEALESKVEAVAKEIACDIIDEDDT